MNQDKGTIEHGAPPGEDKAPAGLLEGPGEAQDEATTDTSPALADETARGGSRLAPVLAGLALLLALTASGATVLLWQMQQRQVSGQDAARLALSQQIETLAAQLAEARQSRSQLRTELSRAVSDVAEREAGLERALEDVREAAGRKRRGWLAAEAEYLVRIANHRLILQRDVTGATKALEAADATLAQTGDPAFIDVRKVLARDIQALKAVPKLDAVGLALRLESLRDAVDTLPLAAPALSLDQVAERQTPTHAAQVEDWRELLGAIWADIKSLVVIREREQGDMPLLAPEQRYFLSENLRLQFEQARLALLREDAALYQARLSSAESWIRSYFDVSAASTQASLNTLADLAAVDVHPHLPAVGDALALLTALRLDEQATTKPAPAAKDETAP